MMKRELVDFWVDSSNQDFVVMESLLEDRHYAWALFLGHLVLEKLIKALYLKKRGSSLPHIHNLLKLAEEASLELDSEKTAFLDEVTAFNIRARYPDYKNRFSNTATEEFTSLYISKIKDFRQWLLAQLTE